MQANQTFSSAGQWAWLDRTEQATSPAAWQNPGGGQGTACRAGRPGRRASATLPHPTRCSGSRELWRARHLRHRLRHLPSAASTSASASASASASTSASATSAAATGPLPCPESARLGPRSREAEGPAGPLLSREDPARSRQAIAVGPCLQAGAEAGNGQAPGLPGEPDARSQVSRPKTEADEGCPRAPGVRFYFQRTTWLLCSNGVKTPQRVRGAYPNEREGKTYGEYSPAPGVTGRMYCKPPARCRLLWLVRQRLGWTEQSRGQEYVEVPMRSRLDREPHRLPEDNKAHRATPGRREPLLRVPTSRGQSTTRTRRRPTGCSAAASPARVRRRPRERSSGTRPHATMTSTRS